MASSAWRFVALAGRAMRVAPRLDLTVQAPGGRGAGQVPSGDDKLEVSRQERRE